MSIFGTLHPVVGALRRWVRPLPTRGVSGSADFDEFETDAIVGLARVDGEAIDILSVLAKEPGQGDGGRLIDALTANYAHVRFLHVMSHHFTGMLTRRGFTPFSIHEDGEDIPGFEWKRS